MKKWLIYGFVAVLLYVPVVFADVTIAVIAPKAGVMSKAGKEIFDGVELAVSEINENGGVNKQKIDILTIDDRCDDRLAFSTAEMLSLLSSKKIVLTVGPYCTAMPDEISAIYEKSQIFQIMPTIAPYYTGSDAEKDQIVTVHTRAQMSKDFFNFYNANFAGLKVGLVYDGQEKSGYGEVAKTLYEDFRRFGKGNLLKFYMFDHDNQTIDDMVDAVDEDKINLLFVLGRPDDVSLMIKEIRIRDIEMIVFASKGAVIKHIKDKDEDFDDVYIMDIGGFKNSLPFTEVMVDLRLAGVETEGLHVYGYASVKLWADMVKKIKSFDYNKMVKATHDKALENWNEFFLYSGRKNAVKYMIEHYKDGALKQVY